MNRSDDFKRQYPPVADMTQDAHIRTVRDIFSSITREYDFLNHFLSMRRDIAWRRFTVRKMVFPETCRFLDVATGTADLAIDAARHFPDILVTGVDIATEMLEAGLVKIGRLHLSDRITLIEGDALSLPFPDDNFDVAAIAFGIRNIPDKIRALREMRRVIRPGGQVMILEMTLPEKGSWLRSLYSIYLRRFLPLLARPFSKNPAAYTYLADSISRFPAPPVMAQMMKNAGLGQIEQSPLSFGITWLHVGRK